MTQAVVSRSQGDDFQARLFWLHAARLLAEDGAVVRVSFENGPRGFDDVTVEYAAGKGPQDHRGQKLMREHFQCKWHVRPGEFGHVDLTDPAISNAQTVSILQRAHRAQTQYAPNGEGMRLSLVTNWRLNPNDALARVILMHSHAIDLKGLFDGTTPASMMGKIRAVWGSHLGISEQELQLVARTLAITQRLESGREFRERLNDRFASVGMQQVPLTQAGFPYDDLIMKLHAQGRNVFDPSDFHDLLSDEKLLEKKQARPLTLGVRSFMHPIDDIGGRTDVAVDLVPQFDGRYIIDPAGWQASVYPDLRSFLLDHAKGNDVLRLVLDTHVSLAVGVGAILNVKSGKAIEIEQRADGRQIWSSTDRPIEPAWPTISVTTEDVRPNAPDIAVSIGLTHETAKAVRAYMSKLPTVGTLLLIAAEGGASNRSVQCGAHAFKLAEAVAAAIRAAAPAKRHRVHVFMAAPNAFAFFLGQNQAAIGPLTVYEYDFDGLRDRDYSVGLELP